MNIESYKFEFLTPCFCSGADQSTCELRASAIRGQLRWWFRAIGGSREDEVQVFGGASQGDARNPVASKVLIRVKNVKLGPCWQKPEFTANDVCSYVWHFAKVSGLDADAPKREKTQGGERWRNDAFFPPQTRWEMQLLYRGEIRGQARSCFEMALKCFLALGGIGMRVSRGLGGFACKDHEYDDSVRTILTTHGFAVEERAATERNIYDTIGALVKGTRKEWGWKNTDDVQTPSPLGRSSPRQTSAVYFRFVKKNSGQTALVVFAAPYERVLSPESWQSPIPLVGPRSNLRLI